VKAAQELLGVPTIGEGSAWAGGGGGGSLRRQISPQPAKNQENCIETDGFAHFLA
jgi:hypothetical protein